MKNILVLLTLLAVIACSSSKTHYRNDHTKTHYRSPGTRTHDRETQSFHHKIIPQHNSVKVQEKDTVKKASVKKETVALTQEQIEAIIEKTKVKASPSTEPPSSKFSEASFRKLKAVIVVSSVDGEKGAMTLQFIEEAKRIASFFSERKIQVTTLFSPADKWSSVTAAANGAHFFLYMGHGTTAGENGKWGGFCLTEGGVSSLTINKELKLASNAAILFHYVCGGAGSSAGDEVPDIGVTEATDRVTSYSHPFIDMNASIYFANNYDSSIEHFLGILFTSEDDMETIYKSEVAEWYSKVEWMAPDPYNNKYMVGISSHPTNQEITATTTYGDGKQVTKKIFIKNSYEVAMVFRKDFKVTDLIK